MRSQGLPISPMQGFIDSPTHRYEEFLKKYSDSNSSSHRYVKSSTPRLSDMWSRQLPDSLMQGVGDSLPHRCGESVGLSVSPMGRVNNTLHIHSADGVGCLIHPARPYSRQLKGIHPACPHCRGCWWRHPAGDGKEYTLRVWSTGSGKQIRFYNTGLELHLHLYGQQEQVLLLEVPTPTETWYTVHMDVSTPKGPGLHLDVSKLQRTLQHLDLPTSQGPELHLDLSAQQKSVLLLDLSTLHRPVLHFDVSTL
jgi:hypothetical protein